MGISDSFVKLFVNIHPIVALMMKLGIAYFPLAIFLGEPQITESFFSGIIMTNGFFLAFSFLILSIQFPSLIDKEKAKQMGESMYPVILNKVEKKEEIDKEKAINFLGDWTQTFLNNLFKKIVPNLVWLYSIIPSILSIIIAMAGLIQNQQYSIYLGIISSYIMFFAITNMIWEIANPRIDLSAFTIAEK
ncbi:hypothetical protein ACFL96_07830 [Thermoproteota archaeon]